MNTYKDMYKEFEDSLRASLVQARKLDSSNYNKDVCIADTQTYGNEMHTVKDMQETLAEYYECAKFKEGYIEVIDDIDFDVNAWSEGGEVEVEGVYAQLQVTAWRPMTDEEFMAMLGNPFSVSPLFKSYISPQLLNNAKLLELDNTYRAFTIQCNLLKLYQQDILDFDGLTKAIYSNC